MSGIVCEVFFPSFFLFFPFHFPKVCFLWRQMLIHHKIIYATLWFDSKDLQWPEEHALWISFNEFSARLTAADVSDWSQRCAILCNTLLEDPDLCENPTHFGISLSETVWKIRKNPTLLAVALSAAAQHLIHAALNLYTFCQRARTRDGLIFRWEDWKTEFKKVEADTLVFARVGGQQKRMLLLRHRNGRGRRILQFL